MLGWDVFEGGLIRGFTVFRKIVSSAFALGSTMVNVCCNIGQNMEFFIYAHFHKIGCDPPLVSGAEPTN